MRASTQDIIRTSRPSAARLAILAARHATKSTQNLRWLAAHSTGWVHEMWLAALDVQRASTPCLHEDVALHCQMCGGHVDEDTRVCETCREGVDPVRVCLYCEVELGTLGEHEHAQRNVSEAPHA